MPNRLSIWLVLGQDIVSAYQMGSTAGAIGVVQFSDRVRIEQQLSIDQAATMTTVGKMQRLRGGTDIGRGLQLALAVLEGRRQTNSVSAVILLTDGHTIAPDRARAAATRIPGGCALHCYGFGDHDSQLLSGLAESRRRVGSP